MNSAKSFRPFSATILLFVIILMSGLVSCASTNQGNEPMPFPDDVSQPFVVLEQVLGGDQDLPEGLFSKMLGLFVGPEQTFKMNQPTDMVVDEMGRLLIVESEAGYISLYSQKDGKWINTDRVSLLEIHHPTSITAGPDKIYVSDLMGGNVHILDYDLNLIGSIDHPDMQRPSGLCYDSFANRVLIADPPSNRVFVFSPGGEYVSHIGRGGFASSQLRSPIAMTVDPKNGHIFVVDAMSRKVKIYDTDFHYISSFGQYDQVPGSFAFPKGIALAVDGTLFVGDAAFGNIQMFNPTGALLFYFGETGTERGQFLMPRNMFLDGDHNLFVADPYNNRVQIFRYFPQ